MSGQLHRGGNAPRGWAPLLLVLAAGGLYLFRLGRVGLYDLDEAVYAEIAREMLALKNWLTPHLDYIPYLEKPPLLYWLDAMAMKALGLSAFAARLPGALAAVAGVGFVYGLGRDLWGRRAGLASAAMLATSFGYFVFGRMGMPDMLFAVLLTGVFWAFGHALLEERPSPSAVYLGYVATAGAVLAKGLAGLALPGLAVVLFILLTRDWSLVRRLKPATGGALFLVVVAPWHILIARANPQFLQFYFINEHVMRFLGHRPLVNFASLPVPTYLAMTLVWFCPWCLFLPAAIAESWPRSKADRGSLWVLLWGAVVVGFFAISSSRLEYYALPALPAFALWVGRLWDVEIARPPNQPRPRVLRWTWGALIIFVLCLAPAAYLFPRLEHMRFYNLFPEAPISGQAGEAGIPATAQVYDVPGFGHLVPLLEAMTVLLIAGAGVAAWAWFRRRTQLALSVLVAAMAAALVVAGLGFARFAPYRSVSELAQVVNREYRPGDQILLEGVYEHHAGLGFYTGQRIHLYHGHDGVLVYGSRHPKGEKNFVTEAEFAQIWRGLGRAFLVSDAVDRGDHLRALDPDTVVLGRAGRTWLFANRNRN